MNNKIPDFSGIYPRFWLVYDDSTKEVFDIIYNDQYKASILADEITRLKIAKARVARVSTTGDDDFINTILRLSASFGLSGIYR